MPKIIKFLIVTSGLLGQLSQAQQMVFDPQSLGEMVNQTAQMREQVVQFKEMIDVTKEARDAIGITRTELSSMYNKTFGFIGETKRLIDEVESIPGHMEYILNEFARMSDCFFEDMNAYTKAETLYKTRYPFNQKDEETGRNSDRSLAGKLYGDQDTEAYQLSDGSTAGAYSPLQLMENPCGMEIRYYEDLKRKIVKEKNEIIRLDEEQIKIAENLKETQKRYTAWAKASQDSKTTLKELNANSQGIQLEMLAVLNRIDRNLHGLYKMQIRNIHDPTQLKDIAKWEAQDKFYKEIHTKETDGKPLWYVREDQRKTREKNPNPIRIKEWKFYAD